MSTNRKITEVQHFPPRRKLKVAVYCRVSTTHDDQAQSLSNQISYYKLMVNSRVNWELVDIYSDVQSGKNTSGRPEFQRMPADCHDHRIEMIVTKSVSRFGRNTAETLDVLHKLRNLLVDVYFEADNIHTQETRHDFLISILQDYAQAESEARSHNIKWGITKSLESGRSKLYNRKCFGYSQERDSYLVEGNHLAIISEEQFEHVKAEKVRRSNIQADVNGIKRKSTHYSMKQSRETSG